jgi:hypothetical protein
MIIIVKNGLCYNMPTLTKQCHHKMNENVFTSLKTPRNECIQYLVIF